VPPRIMVFNHTEHILTLFQAVLAKQGYEVSTHLQALEHLSEVERVKPDLIILGYIKGYDENDIEMIHALRANPNTANISVIVCSTGYARLDTDTPYKDIEYIEVVPKPFEPTNLLDKVDRLLRLRIGSNAPQDSMSNGSSDPTTYH
jgi:DNA-binding response OmpR family regulator